MPTDPLRPLLDLARRLGGADDITPDRDLLARFVGGDAVAFEQLVRRHGPMVRGVCRRMLRDPHTADDAFQATFLLLVRKARALKQPEHLGPWLHGVAVRVSFRARERVARRREQPASAEPAAVADSDSADWRPVLDAAIGRLPARERDAVVMCYFDGLTYAEAAERLRCPLGTLASHLARARERLRDRLGRQGFGPPAVLFPLVDAAERVGPELLAATAAAAASLGAGSKVGVSASVLALVTGVRRAMFIHTAKIALATTALIGVAGTGVGVLVTGQGPGPAPANAPSNTPPVVTTAQPVPPVDAPKVAQDVPLALLKKPASSTYLVQPGDVLGIYVEGVLGKAGEAPPIIQRAPGPAGEIMPPAVGYPIAVSPDGAIRLPLVDPVPVVGERLSVAEERIRKVYTDANILVRGKERVLTSLAYRVTHRVTVFRRDQGGGPGGFTLELTDSESDVLTALAKSGGLPADRSNAVVVVQRRAGDSNRDGVREVRIPLRLRPGEPPPTSTDVSLGSGDVVTVDVRDDSARDVTHGAPASLSFAVALPDGRILAQIQGREGDRWEILEVNRVTAQETDGKTIPVAALVERLKSMAVVVVAADGKVPGPTILAAVKPGTPVIVSSGQ